MSRRPFPEIGDRVRRVIDVASDRLFEEIFVDEVDDFTRVVKAIGSRLRAPCTRLSTLFKVAKDVLIKPLDDRLNTLPK